MNSNEIIGREYEKRLLQERYDSGEAELVIVYGRRRVGKTFLVKKYFENQLDFYLTGVFNCSRQVQLGNFAMALEEYSGDSVSVPTDWTSAFMQLKRFLKSKPQDQRQLVFIDEMPWLATAKSDFLTAFEMFWNGWGATQNNLMLIVCGSATTWITDKLLSNKGGLFNRCTLRLCLSPFTLGETEQYLVSKNINMSRHDIAECYMIMGGIPFYLKQMSSTMPYNANIDNIFFKKNALLQNEFNSLYNTLFSNADTYIRIVEALSVKNMGLTRKEIVQVSKLSDNGVLTKMLDDLIASGLVVAYNYWGSHKKNTLFQICDFFTLFYFRFIKNQPGHDENFWTKTIDNPSRRTWAGLSFEMLCKCHIAQIKRKIGISAVLADTSVWFRRGDDSEPGCQIDLLINRRDHVINVCECKFSMGEYVIDRKYEADIMHKLDSFRKDSKTKSAIHFTMITTYGLARNSHSSIVQSQVSLDDLFEECD